MTSSAKNKPLAYVIRLNVQDVALLPEAPGVYMFYNNKQKIIYVGKARALRKRVKSYFQASTLTSTRHNQKT